MLLDAFQRGEQMTNKELLKTARKKCNSKLTKDSVHSFVGRYFDVLQECGLFPLEASRLAVLREPLEEHRNTPKAILAGKFSELVFNLDEEGSSEWGNVNRRKSLLPGQSPQIKFFILSPKGIAM
jgi:hypothetical protein